jgi:hypothetical protein
MESSLLILILVLALDWVRVSSSNSHFHHGHHRLHRHCDYCNATTLAALALHSPAAASALSAGITDQELSSRSVKNPTSGRRGVVDVFLVVTTPKNYQYIESGAWWAGPLLLQAFAVNNDTRVHIFSDAQEILDQGSRYGGFYMHDMRQMKALQDSFFAMYKVNHHSINDVNYEFLCFYRWLMFRSMVDYWQKTHTPEDQISKIVTIDSDVLIMTNALDFFDGVLRTLRYGVDQPYELIIITPGAVHLWSYMGLISYSDYIYEWYNKRQVREQNRGDVCCLREWKWLTRSAASLVYGFKR